MIPAMDSVVFDMGGVVLDWDPGAILAGYYPDPALRAQLKVAAFDHADWRALDRGTLDEKALVLRLAERTGRPVPELAGLLVASRESLTPKPATLDLIERLHTRGVPLYVLSNMSGDTYEHLRQQHVWWRLFRGVVISGLIRMAKPDREIFEHLLKEHGLVARHTIFIDDNRPNLEAAAELGIRTIWFRDAAQCEQELHALLDAGDGPS